MRQKIKLTLLFKVEIGLIIYQNQIGLSNEMCKKNVLKNCVLIEIYFFCVKSSHKSGKYLKKKIYKIFLDYCNKILINNIMPIV